MREFFAVKFTGVVKGVEITNAFYSEKQPKYDWSFTTDLNEALLYKTKRYAQQRVEDAKMCGYKDLQSEVVSVFIDETRYLSENK